MMARSEEGRQRRFAPVARGQRLRARAFAWCQITESRYPPGLVLERHAHQRTVISINCIGAFQVGLGRQTLVSLRNDVLYLPRGCQHSNSYSPNGTRVLIVELFPSPPELADMRALFPKHAHVASPAITFRLAQEIVREFEHTDEASSLALEELALGLVEALGWTEVNRCSDESPRWLFNVVDYLHANYAQRTSMQELARLSGVHAMHLARVFRRRTGRSVGEYLRTLRIQAAASQLEASRGAVAEIAHMAGFYDQSHFTRFFKRQMGVTPLAYRHLRRGGRDASNAHREHTE